MAKIQSGKILYALLGFVKGSYDVLIPNYFYGYNECDLFRITEADLVIEYEVKVSRGDYFADFKKESRDCKKHDELKNGRGKYCPNRFFYVMPEGMVTKEEVPKYAGLIYSDGNWCNMVKSAPLLHRNKVSPEIFRQLCRSLSNRDEAKRKRIAEIRNTDFDREMAAMTRDVEHYHKENVRLSNDNFLLKHQLKTNKNVN